MFREPPHYFAQRCAMQLKISRYHLDAWVEAVRACYHVLGEGRCVFFSDSGDWDFVIAEWDPRSTDPVTVTLDGESRSNNVRCLEEVIGRGSGQDAVALEHVVALLSR